MLAAIEIQSIASPSACVIWLHGLGADGHDFVPVVEMLGLPHLRFVLPHAPYRPVTLNNGFEMRAWYDILGLEADSPQDETGIRHMQAELESMIVHQQAQGIPSHRIVLAGFSQGGGMVLHCAPRFDKPLAGVLALSTYLPLRDKLKDEKNDTNIKTPIWMAHGRLDTVIAEKTAIVARNALLEAGFEVDWHLYEMAHSVCDEEIDDIRQFLLKVLPQE